MSMTRKVMDGRIWQSGETFLLELKNGSLVQKLGTFYQQKTYKDLENMNIQNVTDDVITADGVQRPLITINGVFPGPTLEVIEGSEVSTYTELHTFMPYPCSHFYFDIKFGDRLYSKENRPGSPLLF